MFLVRPLLKNVVHLMAHVDHSSLLLLNINERIVDFSVDHDIPWLAQTSIETVQMFDHIGTNIIAFALWLAIIFKNM